MTVEELRRPPMSGAGSGVAAWRAYAAAVTDSPAESWAALSREEILALLDAEGVAESVAAVADAPGPAEPAPTAPPVWMVPTEHGLVPEHEHRGR